MTDARSAACWCSVFCRAVSGGSQLLFERRVRGDSVTQPLIQRRESLGRRGQVGDGTLLRVPTRGLGFGQSRLDCGAGRDYHRHCVAEFLLTPRQPLGCRGQVGFGSQPRGMMGSLGLNQPVLDRCACRDSIRQRCAHLGLAQRQSFRRGCHFELPVASGLLERRGGITQLPVE